MSFGVNTNLVISSPSISTTGLSTLILVAIVASNIVDTEKLKNPESRIF